VEHVGGLQFASGVSKTAPKVKPNPTTKPPAQAATTLALSGSRQARTRMATIHPTKKIPIGDIASSASSPVNGTNGDSNQRSWPHDGSESKAAPFAHRLGSSFREICGRTSGARSWVRTAIPESTRLLSE
jgi:hypothetical protein